MPTRRRLTWIVFAVCVLAVLEGLGWITWKAIRLERRAAHQELVSLALWRMDSELTPIIAHEAARPYFHYRSFYPAERAYNKMWQEVQPGEVRVPSPLLESSGQFVRLHFQIEPDGEITSPQAPTGNMRDLAESAYVDSEFIVYAGEMLARLTAMLNPAPQTLAGGDTRSASPSAGVPIGQTAQIEETSKSREQYQARQEVAQQALTLESQRGNRAKLPATSRIDEPADQLASRDADAMLEKKEALGALLNQGAPPRVVPAQPTQIGHAEVDLGSFEPLWLSDPDTGSLELVLRRTVRTGGVETVQGVWLDWPTIHRRLVAIARERLPGAEVEPVTDGRDARRPQMLANIPALLVAAPPALAWTELLSATSVTFAFTWLAVIGAIIAIGVVLQAAMALGDRRGRFVSAVTHELRTPLTTFCLYTEMLADGMVPDEASRREYLGTLKSESRRLARIVENVLDYARLGQARAHHNGPIDATELVERLAPVVRRRTEQDGMQLVLEASGLEGVRVKADEPTVERIVLNLIDNACKYAGQAGDKRVHVTSRVLESGGRSVFEIRVRDHGPGVPRAEEKRVFEEFHRARRDEQGPKSGLGLGLALSRGLARQLGGNLELVRDPSEPGAELRLTLPAERNGPR